MKIAYLDVSCGIAGDMFLAALLDGGLPEDELRQDLELLGLSDEFELQVRKVRRGSMMGTHLKVLTASSRPEEHLSQSEEDDPDLHAAGRGPENEQHYEDDHVHEQQLEHQTDQHPGQHHEHETDHPHEHHHAHEVDHLHEHHHDHDHQGPHHSQESLRRERQHSAPPHSHSEGHAAGIRHHAQGPHHHHEHESQLESGSPHQLRHPREHQGHEHGRRYLEIVELIRGSALPEGVKNDAISVFTLIGEVEARIHGTTLENVHFHEVGAVDSIVDIVGAAAALQRLGIQSLFSSAVTDGYGTVRCDHGVLPVPAPASLALLRGVPLVSCDIPHELVTPTGAGILRHFCRGFGPRPAMVVESVGYGAGSRDLPQRPNLLRISIGSLLDRD